MGACTRAAVGGAIWRASSAADSPAGPDAAMVKTDEVKLSSCQICKNSVASDAECCRHCGTKKPHKKEEPKKKDHLPIVITLMIVLLFWLALFY
jgi:hypothetical protein